MLVHVFFSAQLVVEEGMMFIVDVNNTKPIVFYNYPSMQSQQQKHQKFMQRNVTDFKHLIKEGFSTENELNWAINLREHPNIPKSIPKRSEPFQVYFKETRAVEERRKEKENEQKIRSHDYPHMIAHSDPSDGKHSKQTG